MQKVPQTHIVTTAKLVRDLIHIDIFKKSQEMEVILLTFKMFSFFCNAVCPVITIVFSHYRAPSTTL